MSTTDVRLLYPNLGQEAGEVVTMEAATARLWVHRRLAEPVDEEAAAAIHDAYQTTQVQLAAAMERVTPPSPRPPAGPALGRVGTSRRDATPPPRPTPTAPPIRPVNRSR